MIHVSDLAAARQCPREAWNNRQHPAAPFHFNTLDSFEDLWKQYLKIENPGVGKAWDSNENTLRLAQNHDQLLHARFEYKEIRTQIPALIKLEDGTWKAVYPVMSLSAREPMAWSLLFNRYLAHKAGIEISQHEVLTFNKDYVRKETIHPDELFVSSLHLKKARGGAIEMSIDELLDARQADLDMEEELDAAVKMFESNMPEARKCSRCMSPKKCVLYDECFNQSHLPDDSIQFLSSAKSRQEMEEEGIALLKDTDPKRLEGLNIQYAQIQADKNGGIYCDVPAMKAWMETIEGPVSFLDFEWDTFAIPPYENMKPFDVLCFQYSLHIRHEDGRMTHASFFEQGDCRKNFIESLLAEIPDKGTILVFNMEGGEKLRLSQLARQFPEYAKQLEALNERMVDLSAPFEYGFYYDLRQRGHYSLKTLLPLFSDHATYHSLDVQDGLQAVMAYRKAMREPENAAAIGEEISEYCAMDTYAEIELLDGLKQFLERKENA